MCDEKTLISIAGCLNNFKDTCNCRSSTLDCVITYLISLRNKGIILNKLLLHEKFKLPVHLIISSYSRFKEKTCKPEGVV